MLADRLNLDQFRCRNSAILLYHNSRASPRDTLTRYADLSNVFTGPVASFERTTTPTNLAIAAAMSTRSFLLFFYLYFTNLVAGQLQSVLQPTTPAPAATVVAGGFGYTYAGCWNETAGYTRNNGARALSGGRYVRYGCQSITAIPSPRS